HRLLEPEVRHHGRHQRVALEHAELLESDREYAHDLVAVDHTAQGVHGHAPIGIAVEGHTEVGLGFDDEALQRVEVSRTGSVVDVAAIGFGGGDDYLGAGLTQSGRSVDGRGSVSAVDDDL